MDATMVYSENVDQLWLAANEKVVRLLKSEAPYASPTVSNSAASIDSAVDFPAHTTNWNAG